MPKPRTPVTATNDQKDTGLLTFLVCSEVRHMNTMSSANTALRRKATSLSECMILKRIQLDDYVLTPRSAFSSTGKIPNPARFSGEQDMRASLERLMQAGYVVAAPNKGPRKSGYMATLAGLNRLLETGALQAEGFPVLTKYSDMLGDHPSAAHTASEEPRYTMAQITTAMGKVATAEEMKHLLPILPGALKDVAGGGPAPK